jgi:hypothetical protein
MTNFFLSVKAWKKFPLPGWSTTITWEKKSFTLVTYHHGMEKISFAMGEGLASNDFDWHSILLG